MPALITASLLLELDRTFGTQFYDAAGGGDPILWQHLFWWFGHPDVYIIFLPAFGIIAAILPVFTRREIVGYIYVILAVMATGLISLSAWAHHMFAVGMPWLALGFFAAMTLAVAIPAGVMLSAVPFNFQVHDTHWVVAHFHQVLIGGMVFPLFAGLYYWLPKTTGRMLSRTMGIWNFWLAFIGFKSRLYADAPVRLLGQAAPGLYLPAGHGARDPEPSFFHRRLRLRRLGAALPRQLLLEHAPRPARGKQPLGANTLEWATSSPPADYNFRFTASVRSRSPHWAQPEFPGADRGYGDIDRPREEVFVNLRDDRRELLATTVGTAAPDSRVVASGPSIWPFMTALATTVAIAGVIITLWFAALGAGLAAITLLFWHWPDEVPHRLASVPAVPHEILDRVPPERRFDIMDLPDHVSGPRDVMWWGMCIFLVIEAVMIALLIFAYFYINGNHVEWPLGDTTPSDLPVPIVYSAALFLSSAAFYLAQRGVQRNDRALLIWGLLGAALLAMLYLALKVYEYATIEYSWYENAYTSLSWTLSWFHGAHVFTTILKVAAIFPLAWRGYFAPDRYSGSRLPASTGISS